MTKLSSIDVLKIYIEKLDIIVNKWKFILEQK